MSRERHLTPMDLDALALGLLSPHERAPLELHASSCPACYKLRDEHAAHARHFTDRVLPRTIGRVRSRLGARRRARWALAAATATIAVAAVVLVWRAGGPGEPFLPGGTPELAAKGAANLQVFARRDQHVFAVSEGTMLASGDAIRFFIESNAAGHVIIGSVDGAGKTTIYYPYGGASSTPLVPGRRFEVPGSIVLDRAPGPERIFAVFSSLPLPADQVRQALADLGARGDIAIRQTRELPLAGTSQASVRFEKGEPAP